MVRLGKTDRNSDKDRVRTHLPPEREITGNFDADITEHGTDGEDPLEHREIDILPDKFLERPEPPIVFPERVVRVDGCSFKGHHLPDVHPPDRAARHRGPGRGTASLRS